jgi:hypothetical protein
MGLWWWFRPNPRRKRRVFVIFAMCCMFLYTSTRSWHHTHSNDEDLEKHLGMVVMVEVRPRVMGEGEEVRWWLEHAGSELNR